MTTSELPVPVTQHPHWRVNFRPAEYDPERIDSVAACFEIIERTKVRLRGWDYPHLSGKPGQRGIGNRWVESWVNFLGHVEFWRFYQSGQFIHLFAVRESLEEDWAQELRKAARGHLDYLEDVDWSAVPGFISLENTVYLFSEIFEFAARLSQHQVYSGDVVISIKVTGIKGYVLTPGWSRSWSEYRAASSDALDNSWTINTSDLLAGSAEHSLKAVMWLFERFGWLNPSLSVLKSDQEKFLKGRL